MRRMNGIALLIVIALVSGTAALARGDKLLAIGRGVRFQRVSAAHEANLLIYSAGTERGAVLAGRPTRLGADAPAPAVPTQYLQDRRIDTVRTAAGPGGKHVRRIARPRPGTAEVVR